MSKMSCTYSGLRAKGEREIYAGCLNSFPNCSAEHRS